jgi:hypothetical protein
MNFPAREREIVFALTRVAGRPLSPTSPLPPLPPDAVAAHVVFVARVHDPALAALAMVKDRLETSFFDTHFFAAFDVADAMTIDRALDCRGSSPCSGAKRSRLPIDLFLPASLRSMIWSIGLPLPLPRPVHQLLPHAKVLHSRRTCLPV